MRETVERILNGKFDYDKGALDFSTARIEIALAPGQVYTDSFSVMGMPGRVTEGHIYSNDVRMKIITDSFSGTFSEIGYTFSSLGLEEGDVVQGEFYVVSNQGEYYLPYAVTILQESITSSLGNIKNLFHFTNLAKSNWEEACRLFYKDEFIKIFTGNDLQYKKTYLGLSRYYDNEQNVEEFLLAINKKQPIEYILEREVISLTDIDGIVEEYINITRNGWGYTVLHVKTDSDFVSFERNEINDTDFLGNYLSFPVRINSERLHAGANYAKITFFNAFTSFSVDVVANVEVVTKSELSKHMEIKHARADMMIYYEAFRTKKISADTWLAETGHIVDRMLQIDDKDLPARLFKAQVLITEERYNEAKWILDQTEAELKAKDDYESVLWAYYLYLTTLYTREESYIDSITREVANLYQSNQSEWRMAWMLLYLEEEFAISPSRRWLFVEETIERGCLSPMMLVEAANMLVSNPGFLSKLTSTQLRIIRYALSNEMMTEDLINQFVFLAGKERNYSKPILSILESFFEITPTDEIATIICEMLIKGDRKDEKAHEWYLYAIEHELRVTLVYEYFMESLDISVDFELPKMVFLFFSYDTELPWEYAAYLYARIIAKKDEMPDIFETYKPMIERFAVSEVIDGHINKDLAAIYRFVLPNIAFTEEIAKNLARLLFVHKITVLNSENITKVIVYQSKECVEYSYPVKDGVAYIPLYNKDCSILFEDGFSNRYASSVEYELDKLMIPGKLATMVLPFVRDNLEFNVYACECSSEMIDINEETKDRFQMILDAPEIDSDYKGEIRSKLAEYYFENDNIRELDDILQNLEPMFMTQRERLGALRFMVMRGMYDEAFSWVVRYGVEGVEPKDLVRLCSKLISRNEYEPTDDLTRITADIFFKGKYDETILKYLVANFTGLTKHMRRIFKAAENFDVEIYSLCENMLVQMLYTGYYVSERMDIYKKYVQGGANAQIQSAFLTQCAFDYFVKEQLMEGFVFEELTKLDLRGEEVATVNKLAYLKYYSENEELIDDTIRSIIRKYLEELLSQGMYMSFFKTFIEGSMTEFNHFTDKTIIEYKTEPGKRVFIHYIIEGDGDIVSEYVTEEMKDMYGGVHAKAFILFFGERLLYYITEESDGEELLTESASIQKSDISRDSYDSRFNEINDIVIAKTLQDYDTVNRLLYDYHKHSYIVKHCFKLI